MPPAKIALRFMSRCCGVMVAATFSGARSTKAAASCVVMCSSTIFSFGKRFTSGAERAVDEHRLAIEDVDLGVGHLAVDQQRQARALHRLEHRVALAQVGHARVGIRRGARRVVLHRLHEARGLRALPISAGVVLSVR